MGEGLSGALLLLREELDAAGIGQFEMVLAGSQYAVRRASGVCARELGVGPQSIGGAFSCYGVQVVECLGALPPGGTLRGKPLSPGRGAVAGGAGAKWRAAGRGGAGVDRAAGAVPHRRLVSL